MEELRKTYKKKAKELGLKIRFNNARNVTFTDPEKDVKLMVKFYTHCSHCLTVEYTNFSKFTPSPDLLQFVFEYSQDYSSLAGVDVIEFPKLYPFFFRNHCTSFPTKWMYERTDTYRPVTDLIQKIQRLTLDWQQTNPTLRLTASTNIRDLSPDRQFVNISYYQTGEEGTIGAHFDSSMSIWSFYQGEEYLASAPLEQIDSFLKNFLQKVHNRNRLETTFTPLRLYFDQLCRKAGLIDQEKQTAWFEILCGEYGSHEVEEMCAHFLLNSQFFYQTTIAQKPLSLFRLADKWHVMGRWGVRTFHEKARALACFEQTTLALTWGKELTHQLNDLKREDESTHDNRNEHV